MRGNGGRSDEARAVGLPRRSDDHEPLFVGREEQLHILKDLCGEVIAGDGSRVVVLTGEPGMGKTRLLFEFQSRARDAFESSGLLIGYGQSVGTGYTSDSFMAVRECLRSLFAQSGELPDRTRRLQRLWESLKKTAPDWLEAIPVVGQVASASVKTGIALMDSGQPSSRTVMASPLDQIVNLLEEFAQESPLLLIFDDMHWADPATVDLVITLGTKLQDSRILLVLAYREEDIQDSASDSSSTRTSAHPFQQALHRLGRYRGDVHHISLPKLTDSEIRRLLKRMTPHWSQTELETTLRRSSGNPLFAESLVDSRSTSASNDALNPSRALSVLEERLSFLTQEQRTLLEIAATIGYVFEVQYLAEAMGADVDRVYQQLDELVRLRRLLEESTARGELDRYVFHHPLLGEVLRESARKGAILWRRRNRTLLDIVMREAKDAGDSWDDDVLVRACGFAVEGNAWATAYDLLVRAAARQYDLGAITKAQHLAHQAIALPLGDAHDRTSAVIVAAKAASAQGDCEQTIQLLQGNERVNDNPEALLLLARNLRMAGRWDTMRDTITQIEEAVIRENQIGINEPLASALMLEAEADLCGPVQDLSACRENLAKALSLTESASLRSRILGHSGLAHLAAGDVFHAEQDLCEAIRIARDAGHPYDEYEAKHWLSKKKIACLELEDALSLLAELLLVSESSGVAGDAPFHLRDRSRVLALMETDYPAAADDFYRYLSEINSSAGQRTWATLACQLIELSEVRGASAATSFMQSFTDVVAQHDSGWDLSPFQTIVEECTTEEVTDPVDWLSARLDVPRGDIAAALAIFQFDIPNLGALRQRLESTS